MTRYLAEKEIQVDGETKAVPVVFTNIMQVEKIKFSDNSVKVYKLDEEMSFEEIEAICDDLRREGLRKAKELKAQKEQLS